MKTIAVGSQKGGSGKSVLCQHLAVCAGGNVAAIDLDPQQSTGDWLQARESDDLTLIRGVTPENLSSALEALSSDFSLTIIDTPPHGGAWLRDVFSLANLVVIPVRPSPVDLRSIGSTLDLLEGAETPFLFVVNQTIARSRIAAEAVLELAKHGPVAPVMIGHRVAFAEAAGTGRTVMELDANSRSSQEIADLWKFIRKRLRGKV